MLVAAWVPLAASSKMQEERKKLKNDFNYKTTRACCLENKSFPFPDFFQVANTAKIKKWLQGRVQIQGTIRKISCKHTA